MQCPHCQSEVDVKFHKFALGEDQDGSWQVTTSRCTVCGRLIVELCGADGCVFPIRPVVMGRPRLSADVPAEFESEYHTACQVLPFSPECSAAVGRRLLQRFLAAHTAAGEGPLGEQIDVAADSPEVPAYLREALRTLASTAGLTPDSDKSLRPEALAPAVPGEAEWTLDVLQTIFEVYFVQPARLQRMQSALEEKTGPLSGPRPDQESFAAAPDDDAGPAGAAAQDDSAGDAAAEGATLAAAPLVPPPLP